MPGTLISRIKSVMAIAKTPSLKVSILPVSLIFMKSVRSLKIPTTVYGRMWPTRSGCSIKIQSFKAFQN
jgi:hypothetical protein